jgi:hypothetical protein
MRQDKRLLAKPIVATGDGILDKQYLQLGETPQMLPNSKTVFTKQERLAG